MVVTYYSTLTIVELLAALRAAEQDDIAGGSLIAAGSGDVNTQRSVQSNTSQRIAKLKYALYQKDPQTYGHFQMALQNKTIARLA